MPPLPLKHSEHTLVGVLAVSVAVATVCIMLIVQQVIPPPKKGRVPRFDHNGMPFRMSSAPSSEAVLP